MEYGPHMRLLKHKRYNIRNLLGIVTNQYLTGRHGSRLLYYQRLLWELPRGRKRTLFMRLQSFVQEEASQPVTIFLTCLGSCTHQIFRFDEFYQDYREVQRGGVWVFQTRWFHNAAIKILGASSDIHHILLTYLRCPRLTSYNLTPII